MEIIEQIGSYAGYAAIVGLAVLSALYFSQARDVRRLREWAGKAPERGGEGAPTGQRVVARPMPTPPGGTQAAGTPASQGTGTTRTAPVPGALPGRQPPPVPRPGGAAAAAAGAGPAVATGPAAATPAAARAAGSGTQAPGQAAAGAGSDVVSQDTVAHPPPRPPGADGEEEADGDDSTMVEGGGSGAGAAGAAGAAAGAAGAGAAGPARADTADRNGGQESGEADAARDDSGSWTGEADAAREDSGSWTGEGDAARDDLGQWTGEGDAARDDSGQWTGEHDAANDEDYEDYDEDEDYDDGPTAGDTGDRPIPTLPSSTPRPPTIPPRPPAPVGAGATRGGSILPPYEQSRPGGPPARGRLRGRGRTIALVAAGVLVLGGVAVGATTLLGGDDGSSGSDAQRSSAPAGAGGGGSGGGQGAIDPASVTVAVLNGTTVDGLAADVGDTLTAEGYQLGTVTNGADQARAESVVLFAPGARPEAEDVARRLNIGQREPIDAESQDLAGDASVVVVTGADRIE